MPGKQRRAAERAEKKKRGKQPGSPGTSMVREVPDQTADHDPRGGCACGRDLADAADLGVARSYQQEEIPAAAPADVAGPLAHEFRHAVLAGLASVPRMPAPKNSTMQKPGRELLGFRRDRRDDVLRFTTDTSIWPTPTSASAASPPQDPAEDIRPPGQRRRHSGPAGHPHPG